MRSFWMGGAFLAALLPLALQAADALGLAPGKVELKSANVLTFGPKGILFVGDAKAARIFALQTPAAAGDANAVRHEIVDVGSKIAAQLGVEKATVADIAVNPENGHLFASVDTPAGVRLVHLDGSGAIVPVELENIPHSKIDLPDAPVDAVVGEGRRARNNRMNSITDLRWIEGQLLVSGMRNNEVASAVRSFAFPFNEKVESSGLEIYHGAHGQWESLAPVRTFVPFMINGEPNVLAGFVCTPLVRFPVSAVGSTRQIRGTTVAELGNRNQPLAMIAYEKGGASFLLLANSARGVMKVSTQNIGRDDGIESPVSGGGTAGQQFETLADWAGTVNLDRLNTLHAVALVAHENGQVDLKTMELP